jgi:hypothetical protein
LPQFKNASSFGALSANQGNQGSVPQLPRRESNKQREMNLRRIKEITQAAKIYWSRAGC